MDERLKERLTILREAGMMRAPIGGVVEKLIGQFQFDRINLTDDKAGMFFTHLIASMNRIQQGEVIATADEGVVEEILANENFSKAERYLSIIEKESSFIISKSEKMYIASYLCLMLKREV